MQEEVWLINQLKYKHDLYWLNYKDNKYRYLVYFYVYNICVIRLYD